MKKTLAGAIGEVCLILAGCCLTLPGCGGASDDGGRDQGSTRTKDRSKKDAGADDDKGKSDDDTSDDDTSDDDKAVADDDVVTLGDDDVFVVNGDDDLVPVEDDMVTLADDDVFVVSSDDDLVAADDDIADDDLSVDDDVTVDDDIAADDDVPTRPDPAITPVDPVPVEPGTCEPTGQSVGPGYCQIEERCSNSYQYTYCSDQGDGSWICQCEGNYASTAFQLSGVDQNTACPAVKELCAQGTSVEFTGDPVCMPSYQSVSSSSCDMGETCTQSVAVADGVDAIRQTSSSTSCYDYDNGTLECQCNGSAGYKSYTVTGIDVASACMTLELCSDSSPVPFDAEPTCTTSYESASSSYCEVQRQCDQTATLADGVTVSVSQPDYTNCQFSGGTALCNCSTSVRSVRFGMDVDSTATACSDASVVCQTDEDIVPQGPISCTRSSQSASQAYCDASIDCAQDADVAGTTISIHGNMYTNCQQSGSQWLCQCQSNTESTSFTVDAASGWDACTAASDACPDMIGIDISATSNGYSPYGYGDVAY